MFLNIFTGQPLTSYCVQLQMGHIRADINCFFIISLSYLLIEQRFPHELSKPNFSLWFSSVLFPAAHSAVSLRGKPNDDARLFSRLYVQPIRRTSSEGIWLIDFILYLVSQRLQGTNTQANYYKLQNTFVTYVSMLATWLLNTAYNKCLFLAFT